MSYFENGNGINLKTDITKPEKIVETIANRYIGENPEMSSLYRAFNITAFNQMSDGRVDINMRRKFPECEIGTYAYAASMIQSGGGEIKLAVNCYGPVKIYLNGEIVHSSFVFDDINFDIRTVIKAKLQKGLNLFVIEMENVLSGFGCVFGSDRSGPSPLTYLVPFHERKGQGGWIYSQVTEHPVDVPSDYSINESDTGIKWFPKNIWSDELKDKTPCERIFGVAEGKYAYAMTSFSNGYNDGQALEFNGVSFGECRIWLDNSKVYEGRGGGFSFSKKLTVGYHDLMVETVSSDVRFGFTLDVYKSKEKLCLKPKFEVMGFDCQWLYLGAFDNPQTVSYDLNYIYNNSYWRVDSPDMLVRAYAENPCFGKWNYPLGVTLYGLLQAGIALGRKDITEYVAGHISYCTTLYDYALWDKETFGFPNINQKLVELQMLDDCGSIGNAMLEAYGIFKNPDYIKVARIIADYITKRQERLDDGTFYRKQETNFMKNTIWADDLYMSTPFLVRYYKLTKDEKYLNEAAMQFLNFKRYLFIPSEKLMSHVYNLNVNMANGIPWGRGNGWVLFSLSEILEVMPHTHKDREALLQFFIELSEGILRNQGENGLWHQVLNQKDAYTETSCTAMFIYGMSRGLRLGWYSNNMESYFNAVQKGYCGLVTHTIDNTGNVHGVCCGSLYSFSSKYYKEKLLPHVNDTHGIGIVMLAILEYKRLLEKINVSVNPVCT